MSNSQHEWELIAKTPGNWCSYNKYRCKRCGDTYEEELDSAGYPCRTVTEPEHSTCPGTKPQGSAPNSTGLWGWQDGQPS